MYFEGRKFVSGLDVVLYKVEKLVTTFRVLVRANFVEDGIIYKERKDLRRMRDGGWFGYKLRGWSVLEV